MNCIPGDLAVVVDSSISDNVGLFVTVIEPYSGPLILVESSTVWRCKAKGSIAYRNIAGQVFELSDGPVPDWALRPIRPSAPARKDEAVTQHPAFA